MSTKVKIKHSWNGLRYYLSWMLFSFYLTVAYMFLFTETWSDLIPKGRITIGIILLLFGAFRFYVAYRRYKAKKERIKSLHATNQNAPTE